MRNKPGFLALRSNMTRIFQFVMFCACVIVLMFPPKTFAEESEDEIDEKLGFGVIASSGRHGKGPLAIDAAIGGEVGGEKTPLSASVSRVKREYCEARLTNSSERATYSVSYVVVGSTPNGSNAFRKSFTSSLAPGAKVSKGFRCGEDLNLSVELSSGKRTKLEPVKKDAGK